MSLFLTMKKGSTITIVENKNEFVNRNKYNLNIENIEIKPNTLVIPTHEHINIKIIYSNNEESFFSLTGEELFKNSIFRNLFNFSAFTSGDPHVYPIFGHPFELPTKPYIFRMLQGQDLCINASTRYMTSQESKDIESFYKLTNQTQHVPSNLQTNGTFYKTLRISSDNHTSMIHFTPDNIRIQNSNSKYFHTKEVKPESPLILKKESEIITNTILLSFHHSHYGNLEIQIRTFLNPQTKYGFAFTCSQISNLSGLLIREYDLKSMRLKNIKNETPLIGTPKSNKKLTKQITQSI